MLNNFHKDTYLKKIALKNNIKKTAGKCSLILFVLSISTYIFACLIRYGLVIRGKRLGLDLTNNIETGTILGISSDAYTFFMGYLPCILAEVVAIILAFNILEISFKKDLFCKNQGSFKFVGLGSLSCISVGMISSVIYLIYATLFENKGITIPAPDFTMPYETTYMILFIAYTCVLAPIVEEIIFRGFILKSMQKYGNLSAIIVSSLMFSMFHFNLVQFINPILMGIIFAFMTIKSKSIKSSIIAHMFNNSLIMLTTTITGFGNPIIQSVFMLGYLAAGILAFVLFIVNYSKDFLMEIKEENTIVKTYKKVGYAFTSTWSVVYIIFYIVLVGGVMISSNINHF